MNGMNGMEAMRASATRTWLLTRKNIRLYVKQGPVLIFGLFFPFFMSLAWIIGRSMPPAQVFVGIVAMTTFFTATAISPVVLPVETRERSLERLLTMPASLHEILAGIMLASTLYATILTGAVFALVLVIVPVPLEPGALIGTIAGILLLAVAGSLLGLLASAYPTDMTSNVMVLINLIKFPMIFIGGVFVPLSAMSIEGVIVAMFSPVTFLSDMLHLLASGTAYLGIGVDLLGLLAWIGALWLACMLAHRRTMIKRFAEGSGMMKMQGMMQKG